MIKIAFLMLCHKNPGQINQLINKLCEFQFADIYIHVDMFHSEIRKEIIQKSNVFLIPENDSFSIQWGSVEIVKATLSLIKAVKNSGIRYDYLWLVSGQDYPIIPIDEIEKRLASKPGINYIETIIQEDKEYGRYKKRCDILYPNWINKNTFFVKALKRIYMILTGGYCYTFPVFVRKRTFDFDFAFGSQWWTLTSDAAFEIFEYSESHPEILIYYEQCIIPDESFFQTLFLRGPYDSLKEMNLTYINWGYNRRSPEILTIDDTEKIKNIAEKFCLARKFDERKSASLLSWLDFKTGSLKEGE